MSTSAANSGAPRIFTGRDGILVPYFPVEAFVVNSPPPWPFRWRSTAHLEN